MAELLALVHARLRVAFPAHGKGQRTDTTAPKRSVDERSRCPLPVLFQISGGELRDEGLDERTAGEPAAVFRPAALFQPATLLQLYQRASDLPLKDSDRPALARTPLEFAARNFRQLAEMAQVHVAYAAPDQTRDVDTIEARRTHSIEHHCRSHEPKFAEFAMKFERLGDRERLGGSDFDHCARFLVAQKTRDVVGLTSDHALAEGLARRKRHPDHAERLPARRRVEDDQVPLRLGRRPPFYLMEDLAHHREFAHSRRGVDEILVERAHEDRAQNRPRDNQAEIFFERFASAEMHTPEIRRKLDAHIVGLRAVARGDGSMRIRFHHERAQPLPCGVRGERRAHARAPDSAFSEHRDYAMAQQRIQRAFASLTHAAFSKYAPAAALEERSSAMGLTR